MVIKQCRCSNKKIRISNSQNVNQQIFYDKIFRIILNTLNDLSNHFERLDLTRALYCQGGSGKGPGAQGEAGGEEG